MTAVARLVVMLLAAVLLPAAADAHPKRRAGLWEVRTVNADSIGMPPTRFCVGEQTDSARAHLDRSPGPRGSCTLGEFVRSGEAWVAESVCKEGRSTVTGRAVATGDFENEYRIDTIVTHPATSATGRREDREAVVARWLGPCEAGQRPGDLVVPGMGTLNMDDGTFRAEPPSRTARGAATPRTVPPPAAGSVPSAAPSPASAPAPAPR
ncbi:MAG: DUF3617 family protein [Burkholderiales bacterium]|nr:MAG: DUF3617 family protein [Burkholderiales bacterium]